MIAGLGAMAGAPVSSLLLDPLPGGLDDPPAPLHLPTPEIVEQFARSVGPQGRPAPDGSLVACNVGRRAIERFGSLESVPTALLLVDLAVGRWHRRVTRVELQRVVATVAATEACRVACALAPLVHMLAAGTAESGASFRARWLGEVGPALGPSRIGLSDDVEEVATREILRFVDDLDAAERKGHGLTLLPSLAMVLDKSRHPGLSDMMLWLPLQAIARDVFELGLDPMPWADPGIRTNRDGLLDEGPSTQVIEGSPRPADARPYSAEAVVRALGSAVSPHDPLTSCRVELERLMTRAELLPNLALLLLAVADLDYSVRNELEPTELSRLEHRMSTLLGVDDCPAMREMLALENALQPLWAAQGQAWMGVEVDVETAADRTTARAAIRTIVQRGRVHTLDVLSSGLFLSVLSVIGL